MTKKHYITIAICSLIILIAGALFGYYYKEYIAPESYVIGSAKDGIYKELAFADYYTDEDVLFSQNINKSTFSVSEGIASYEFNFEHVEFNGVDNNYVLYVNDYMLNNINSDAGTISGTYTLNYYDVDKSVLCHTDISINFSFYSLASKLQVSVAEKDLGYLVKFFKTDNFIITLANNPFVMNSTEVNFNEEQYVTVTYVLDGEIVGTQSYLKGSTLKQLNIEQKHLGWTLNDSKVTSSYVVNEDITLNAVGVYENTVTLLVGDSIYRTYVVETGSSIDSYVPTSFAFSNYSEYKVIVDFWTLEGKQVEVKDYVVMEDIEFVASTHYEYLVDIKINETDYSSEFYVEGTEFSLPDLPANFVLEHWEDAEGNVITDTSFIVNSYIYLNAVGTYTTYTLSVQTTGYAQVPTYTIENEPNSKTILEVPTMEGYTFVEWRIESGEGSVDGNEFTFGNGNTYIYAVYNYTGLHVTSEENFNVIIGSDTYTAEGGVHMEDNYYFDRNISGNSSSIVLTSVVSWVGTDGEYEISVLDSGYYKITYTNASYLWVNCGSSAGGGNSSSGGNLA